MTAVMDQKAVVRARLGEGAEDAPTTLYYKNSSQNSDKVYELWTDKDASTETWSVGYAYGKRGSALRKGFKAQGVSCVQGRALFAKLLKEKLDEGYTPGPAYVVGAALPAPDTAKAYAGPKVMLATATSLNRLDLYMRDTNWFMQEKIDGVRLLVEIKAGGIWTYNRKGELRTISTELASELMQLSKFSPLSLDGELKDDVYHVFDVHSLRGVSMDQYCFADRMAPLSEIWGEIDKLPKCRILRPARSTDEKQALIEDVRRRGGEGVVAKFQRGLVEHGRSSDVCKFKFTDGLTAIVSVQNVSRSVQMVLLDEKGVRCFVGNVTIPPNYPVPKAGALIEVEYLNCIPGGRLREPVYRGERDDVGPDDCTMDQIKYKDQSTDPDDEA